jgi:murein peptide amidase A
MEVYLRKKQRHKTYLILFAILTLSLLVGSYFYIDTKKTKAEKVRIEKNKVEQDSKKIDKIIFGQSMDGKPIEGFEIGNGSHTILLLGSIHGDEVGTTDLLNKFVEEIKSNPYLISKSKRLIVIPITNPDGYYDRTDKLNANGVNLNLNFPTSDWQEYGPEGTYAGPEPFSEIESQVIKQVVEMYNPEVMISYHAMGALVTPENNDASVALGNWYIGKTGYEYYDGWDYPGTVTKWFSETYQKPALTVEITKYLESDWEKNKDALMDLISADTMPI